MSEIRSHRDLIVWQKAVEFGIELYQQTQAFPESERYGLISQLRRASVSIASNIAEGYGRGSTSDYLRFLRNARGSLFEIDTQLLFAFRLRYLEQTKYDAVQSQHNEVGRLLAGLIRTLESSSNQ